MGYRRERTVSIAFGPDHPREDMRGFEATMRRLSTRQLLALEELQDLDPEALRSDPAGQRKKTDELLGFIADGCVSWNLEDDDGQPVPITADTLWQEDPGFWTALVEAWTDAIAGVSGPLAQTSSAGPPSPAVSIPMDDL